MFWLNPAAAVAAILALAAAAAAMPALAADDPALGPGARMQVIDGAVRMSGDRAKALRECSALAGKFGQATWGVTQGQQQRACMMGRGQMD